MHRFYADTQRSDNSRFLLSPEDLHHARKVLRLRLGEQAEVFFCGKRFLSDISVTDTGEIELLPRKELQSTEPHLSVTLFQGLPKGDKMDFIVQKAVELGASRIVPVVFSRCIVRLSNAESEKKLDRWRRIAREAGKQSGRCIIPEILPPVQIAELHSFFSSCEHITVPWEECPEGGPLSFSKRYPSIASLGIVIGPEGGITQEEVEYCKQYGCETITLGKRILRTETAGLAALSVFFGLYGEME